MENCGQASAKLCLTDKANDTLIVYLANSKSSTEISLPEQPQAKYTLKWYNPRTGGKLENGTVRTLSSSPSMDLGLPPDGAKDNDWVALLRRESSTPLPETTTRPKPLETLPSTTTPTTTELPQAGLPHSVDGRISGNFEVGGKVWLGFIGPNTGDMKTPSPETQYNMTIWFLGPDGSNIPVQGRFAGNGDLSNLDSNDKKGRVWVASFEPSTKGRYWWVAEFEEMDENGMMVPAGYFHDTFNTFMID